MEEIILKNKKHGMSVLLITIAVYILAIAGRDRGRGERLCGGDDRFRWQRWLYLCGFPWG